MDSQGIDLFSFCSLSFPFALFSLSVHLSTEGSDKTESFSGNLIKGMTFFPCELFMNYLEKREEFRKGNK